MLCKMPTEQIFKLNNVYSDFELCYSKAACSTRFSRIMMYMNLESLYGLLAGCCICVFYYSDFVFEIFIHVLLRKTSETGSIAAVSKHEIGILFTSPLKGPSMTIIGDVKRTSSSQQLSFGSHPY